MAFSDSFLHLSTGADSTQAIFAGGPPFMTVKLSENRRWLNWPCAAPNPSCWEGVTWQSRLEKKKATAARLQWQIIFCFPPFDSRMTTTCSALFISFSVIWLWGLAAYTSAIAHIDLWYYFVLRICIRAYARTMYHVYAVYYALGHARKYKYDVFFLWTFSFSNKPHKLFSNFLLQGNEKDFYDFWN